MGKTKINNQKSIANNMQSSLLNVMRKQGFNIYYGNLKAAQEIYDEVFIEKIYDFETSKEEPSIIDAGSNIGISMLFFKKKYPLSKIICFEPDPNAFLILEKNIISNNLKNVVAINSALSKNNGIISFYGEFCGTESDNRGNSIIKNWGWQRDTSAKILVNSARLSAYVQEEIDFLKIDIEGAEQQVLEELGDKLSLVKEVSIEVHETESMGFENNLEKIKSLLKDYNFTVSTTANDINDLLPQPIQPWIRKVHPVFTLLKASRT